MKILIVADKEEPYIWDFFDVARFKDIDLILSCGDVKADYLSFLVTMIHAPLYYVPGNHNTKYITAPPEGCESVDDIIMTFNGIRILGLGGCQSYNNDLYQYTEKEMAKRVSKLRFKLWKSKGFDILLTHAPAFGLGDGKDLCHIGFKTFNNLLDKYKPKYFFHGHQHLNYGKTTRIIQYNNTKIINGYGYYILEY